jgi:hypothetical protein
MQLVRSSAIRREMTTRARLRRRIQQLRPYPSLLLVMAPLAVVEPLKLVALMVAGKGHWLSGTAMIVAAYFASLLIVERLFRIVKPKLLTLNWFATLWHLITKVRKLIAPRMRLNKTKTSKISVHDEKTARDAAGRATL